MVDQLKSHGVPWLSFTIGGVVHSSRRMEEKACMATIVDVMSKWASRVCEFGC